MSVKNMSKEIEIHYTFTKDSVLQASKLYYDYDMKNSSKRYIGWFFVALVQFGIVGALKHDSFGLLYISTFLVAYWYYGRWYLRARMIQRYYDSKGIQSAQVKFVANDEGLYSDAKTILWDDVLRVIELQNGILIQTQEEALFFDNEAFNSSKQRSLFVKLAKEKGKI